MRALVVLAKIRILEVVRKPSSTFWFFALPVVIFGVLAFVFQNGHPFEKRRVVFVGVHEAAERILDKSEGIFVTKETARERAFARLDSADASAVLLGDGEGVTVVVSPKEEIFGRGLVDLLGPSAKISLREPIKHGYLRFLYPGLLGQAVVLAGLFGMGYSMAKYRQSLFLKKLGTTPLSRAEFVLAQMIARAALVLAQLALLYALGALTLDLHVSWAGGACALGAALLGLSAFMGTGFLIAAMVKSDSVIVDVINAVSIPVALLSEMFFSVESMPPALRTLSGALPSTALVRLFRTALLDSTMDATTLTHNFLILGAWTAVTFIAASRTFRFA